MAPGDIVIDLEEGRMDVRVEAAAKVLPLVLAAALGLMDVRESARASAEAMDSRCRQVDVDERGYEIEGVVKPLKLMR